MQKPPTWELTEAVHTTAITPLHMRIVPATSSVIPHSGTFGPHNPQHIVIANSDKIETTKKSLEQAHQTRTRQLPQTIEHELATTRLEFSNQPLSPADAIIRELGARNTLLHRKTTDFHQKINLANQFYGGDPLGRSLVEFYQKATTMEQRVMPSGIAMNTWAASYAAAHEARLLAQSIQILNQQHVQVLNWLAAVQANDQTQAAAAEAQRVAAESTRIVAEQQRLKAIADAARREQEQVRLHEQARLAAVAETEQLAIEQARKAADKARAAQLKEQAQAQENARIATLITALAEAQANAQAAAEHFAAEQARLQDEMEQRIEQIQKQLETERQSQEIRWKVIDTATAVAQRQAQLATLKIQEQKEKQAQEHHRQQALLEVQTETEQQQNEDPAPTPEVHHVYPASGAIAASGPAFSFASTIIRLTPVTSFAIVTALRSGVTAVTAAVGALLSPVLVGFAVLLMPSRLGNGERFTMSVPLAELTSESSQTLREIADRRGTLDLPVGLGIRSLGSGTEVFVATTDDFHIRSGVPVLHANYDLLNDVYETALPDSPTDFLTWTPVITPGNSSTEQPIVQTETPAYSGAPIVPIEGRLDLNPILVEGWDRFIIVFPDDSGIAPLYVVFSSPYAGAHVKGKYSGRFFNPEQSGGPILDLDWRTAVITQSGIDAVKLHIARLDQSDANDIMVRRLEKILSQHGKITDTDLRYYTHEIRELDRYRAFGYSDSASPSDESQIWNNAHTATLEDYKLGSELSLLYNEEAIAAMNEQDQREYEKDMRSFE